MTTFDEIRFLLETAVQYVERGHSRSRWVETAPRQPYRYNERNELLAEVPAQGRWEGRTCASIDSNDQSGDWRCNCGAETLARSIRSVLNDNV